MTKNTLYTIGFTQKTAKDFFELIKNNGISAVVDVRLNNTSQLAGFSKYPDIVYFLNEICKCNYISDKEFSPEESTLKDYKGGKINWEDYVEQFDFTMRARKIDEYIAEKYNELVKKQTLCLLCSENEPDFCHRRLIAEKFAEIFNMDIKHLQ